MIFSPYLIVGIGAFYITLLFIIAWLAEKDWLPRRLTEHPAVYVLSIGVLACSWAYYGSIDLANEYGYGALAYYMGIGGLFIFAPMLLSPLFRLIRLYQLGSLADVLVFRYRGKRVGAMVSVCMLMAVLPLLALQIQAVADTVQILTRNPVSGVKESNASNAYFALMFCIGIAIFAALFGAGRNQHRGLVTALAVESVVKLVALSAVGLYAVYGVFGSLPQLQWWLVLHPENLEVLHTPIRDTSSHTLLLMFFSSAIAMPHVFHMAFRENNKLATIRHASWGIPLYLLIISLPIYPILWAGFEVGTDLAPEYFTLGLPQAAGNAKLTLLAFLGGLAAATGATIVIVLSLTTMCLNHLILPVLRLDASQDFYGFLVWMRRAVMVVLLALAYLFYYWLKDSQGLTNLAIIAFVETMQFLPGILAVLYWPLANRNGLLAGLALGSFIWFAGLLCPMLSESFRVIELSSLGVTIELGMNKWSSIGVFAFCLNGIVFILVSLLTEQSAQEKNSADISSIDSLSRPMRRELDVTSAQEVKQRLATSLGEHMASTEVDRALSELELQEDETRPYALRRLRDRLEANISGLIGSALSHEMMDRLLPYQATETPLTEDIYYAETQLNQYRYHLTGLAAELDNLRRYHRQILEDLPMAICSLGNDEEVVMWNHAMEKLTNIPAYEVLGSSLTSLPDPWRSLIQAFFTGNRKHLYKQRIMLGGKPHWINLHKADIAHGSSPSSGTYQQDGQVILLEDLTETQRLEEELVHSERLASIGRLAAGVAHEIGNPVTGIACLAQNLEADSSDNEAQETARQILGQTQRISNIVRTLVNFSHSGKTHSGKTHHDSTQTQTSEQDTHKIVDLRQCAEEAINLLALDKSAPTVHFSNDIAPGTTVSGNDQRLTQVMINLLGNAKDASREGGHVWVSSELKDHQVILKVTDEGTGIPAEYLTQVFEPFFTTKEAGVGTGLGLALVYSIIEEHYGSIQVSSPVTPEGGTCFTIVLAAARATD
jgi:signal transduction histidine kinase/Na+/proline symporter